MDEKQGNILIVDDDRQTRVKLTRVLAGQGYAVSAVEGGNEALQKLTTESFDLMLLDILMPKMDGVEVLKRLQADIPGETPEVIVISAVDDPGSIQTCRQLGARPYLKKPVDPDRLRRTIVDSIRKDSGA